MEVTTLIRTVGLDLLKPALPQRQLDGHKGTFGKLLIVGGAVGYTGAPYLTASAAVRTGCGLVSLGVTKTIWPIEAAKCVSAMPFPLPEKNGMLAGKALPQILEKLDGCDVLAGTGAGPQPGDCPPGVGAAENGKTAGAGRRRHKRPFRAYRSTGCPPGQAHGSDAP